MCVWPKTVRPCCQLTAGHICMRLMATVVSLVAQFGFLTSYVRQQRRRERRLNTSDLLALRKICDSINCLCMLFSVCYFGYVENLLATPNTTCPWPLLTTSPHGQPKCKCAPSVELDLYVLLLLLLLLFMAQFCFWFSAICTATHKTRTSTTLPTACWSWSPCLALLFSLNMPALFCSVYSWRQRSCNFFFCCALFTIIISIKIRRVCA